MRSLLVYCLPTLITSGVALGIGYTWKPAPQPLEVAQGRLDVVLSDPLPEHWALTVIARDGKKGGAEVSAGSVELDGPFIEHVNNVDLRRLEIQPGVVRIRS